MYDNDSSKQWNERLREAMLARDKSQTDISRATGITPAGIKKWLDGAVSKPKFDDVFDVCTYLDITPEWLMKGIGSMNDKSQLSSSNMVSIQQVDYFGSCGLGVMNFEDFPEIKTLQVTPAWFNKNFSFYNPRDIKIITALGDSMEPEIRDGDAVFIDITDRETLRDGIYLLVVDGEAYIKRIQKLIGKKIALISSNKAYKDIEVSLDSDIEIRVLGRVIKSLKLVDI